MSTLTTFISAKTHNYIVNQGIIQQYNDLMTEAYTRIITPVNTYQFDPTFGSEIPTFFNKRIKINATLIINSVNNALKIMIDEGRASAIGVVVTNITLNAVWFTVNITDLNNKVYPLNMNYIGGTK